jgi:hypothetical protein
MLVRTIAKCCDGSMSVIERVPISVYPEGTIRTARESTESLLGREACAATTINSRLKAIKMRFIIFRFYPVDKKRKNFKTPRSWIFLCKSGELDGNCDDL